MTNSTQFSFESGRHIQEIYYLNRDSETPQSTPKNHHRHPNVKDCNQLPKRFV